MGNIKPQTGKEIVTELFDVWTKLAERINPEVIEKNRYEVVTHLESFHGSMENLPAHLRAEMQDISIYLSMPEVLINHLATRINEPMTMEIVDKTIEMFGKTLNAFPRELTFFISAHLWGLTTAPFDEGEGLTYINMMLEKFVPGEGYEARMEKLPESKGTELVIDNLLARLEKAKYEAAEHAKFKPDMNADVVTPYGVRTLEEVLTDFDAHSPLN